MSKRSILRTLLGASLLCGAGFAVQADDTVTFKVDMSSYTNSAGLQAATLVDVRGAFNGWAAGSTLVNNGANVYTNTFVVAGAPATDLQYKFTFSTPAGTTWEDDNPPPGPGQPPDAGNNRVLTLSGGVQTLPVVPFYAPSVTLPIDIAYNNVTFKVDMSVITNGTGGAPYSQVNVSGALNNWGQTPLVNVGGNIYSNTLVVFGAPGAGVQYKFTFSAPNGINWEDSTPPGPNAGGNRLLTLGPGASSQVLPLAPFYAPSIGLPLEYVTNAIKFQVDMQVQGVGFINGGGVVRVSGAYNGWGNGDLLTNDPALPFPANYVYSGTFTATYQKYFPNFPAASEFSGNRYKFRANGGWEEPAFNPLYNSNDRSWSGTNSGPNLVLPLVKYSDASLCDTLHEDTTVTFVLHMTNGTVATDGHVFDKNTDTLYINGESLLGVWQTWDPLFVPPLVNNPPGSDYYEYTQVIPAGRPRNQKVKYSVGGTDNEAPQFSDHVQWIRTTNTAYVMAPVEFGTNYASVRVQPQYGNLQAGRPSGGTVPITWLGCECVTLQARSSLSSGSWTDWPATESASSTNVPNIGQQYFRLQKRPVP